MRQVLIVEDEWLVAENLKEDLLGQGFSVLGPALRCKDALDILAEHQPALAIVDTLLGQETCETVLDACKQRSIPVVISTGHIGNDVPEFARGWPVLSKPYAIIDLVALLTKHL